MMAEGDKALPRFWKCLVASAAAHAALLMFILQNPIWLASLWHTMFGKIHSRTVDLLSDDGDLNTPDTTFDLFLTKRPDSKPFDLPQTSLNVVQHREEIASLVEMSDLAFDIPSQLTEALPCITREQPEYDAALAELPIPVLELPIQKTVEIPAMFFAAVANLHLPILEAAADQNKADEPLALTTTPLPFSSEEVEFASFVRASTEISAPSEVKKMDMFTSEKWEPVSSPPELENPVAVSAPFASPDMETLQFPLATVSLSSDKEIVSNHPLLPSPSSSTTDMPDNSIRVSPKRESTVPVTVHSELASTEENFTQSVGEAMAKPRLSTSSILIDETLSYTPNFAFGNDRIPPVRCYGLPDIGSVSEWKNLFAIDVQVMPRKKEEDFLFSVVLTPKKEASAYALKQNFYFVIDCTSHTSRYRIPIYKRAVERALGYLDDKQTFNIFLLHEDGIAFRDASVAATDKEIAKARDFLDKETYKAQRHKRDFLRVLKHIAEQPKAADELHTVVLLSDGHLFESNQRKRKEFHSWLRKQDGKMALYAATVGGEERSIDLELFAAASGGNVLVSSTNASFTRKFAKLIMDLRYPLATVVAADLRSNDPDNMSLGSQTILPHLFAGQTYTFVGTAKEPEDFIFNMEAISKGRFIEINQQLSLKNGSKPSSSLRTLLLLNQARGELAQFLDEGEDKYIEHAAKLLSQAESK